MTPGKRGFSSPAERKAAMAKLAKPKSAPKQGRPVGRLDTLVWADLAHTFALTLPGRGPEHDELLRKLTTFFKAARREELRREPVELALRLAKTLRRPGGTGIEPLALASRVVARLRSDERTAVIDRLSENATGQNTSSAFRDGYKDYLWLAGVRVGHRQTFTDALTEHHQTFAERLPRRMDSQEQANFQAGARQAYRDLVAAYGGEA